MTYSNRNMSSTTKNKKDKSVCSCEHDYMKVNCKKCGKSIDVPSESPPNEYGYGYWECFEKDEKEAIFSDTKSITELLELSEKLKQERDAVLDKISEIHLSMLNNIAKGISEGRARVE